MWRSRLPPLLSHLRRRTASACSGSSSLLEVESGSSSARNSFLSRAVGTWPPPHVVCYGCGGANQLEQRRRHLYLALDDWEKGFSLYKLSLDDLLLGDELAGKQRLPDPILRLGFRTVGSHPQFHSLGSNIVVTTSASKSNGGKGLTLVYDTETAELYVEHSFPRELGIAFDAVAVAGGSKLRTLSRSNRNGGFLCLCQGEPLDAHLRRRYAGAEDDDEYVSYCDRPQRRWTWEATPSPAPPPPPKALTSNGSQSYVSARALHPDGRTIFYSVRGSAYGEELGTFSLDLEDRTAGYSWARRGDWCLPFYGDASYDADLGAWVGTRNVQDGCFGHEHLCSCDVVPAAAGDDGLTEPPAWTVAAGRLTFLEPGMKPMQHRHGLLSIAGGGGVCYCRVEPAVRQGFVYGSGNGCLLRLTLFRARYGRNGELLAAPLRRQQRPPRSYLISRYVPSFDVRAFWI